jgi:hypothetical protein
MAKGWRDHLLAQMQRLGWDKTRLNKEADFKKNYIHDFFSRDTTPSIDVFNKIADVVGVTMTQLYHGVDKLKFNFLIIGRTTGENHMWTQEPPNKQTTIPVTISTDETVGIKVDDDTLRPRYSRGDYIIGVRHSGSNFDNLINLECIVETTTGDRYFGILKRGAKAGKYTLGGLDPMKSDIENVSLAWIAPIRMVLRGYN